MVSIVIVNYKVKKELFGCIESIVVSKPKTKYEIIVVDNDQEKTIEKELLKKFAGVKYIPNENKGFGEGNNAGVKQAKGEYLFFLNPDTKFINNSIDILIRFLDKNTDAAICAPLLFDKNKKLYPLQGILELTPLRAVFSLSFIAKLFPKNKINRDYYLMDWDKSELKEVDAVPGTAFVIRKKVFDKIGGFDEKFFLYFEEFDLCKRVKESGWKIFMVPFAKVSHAWGESTKKVSSVRKYFLASRFYYFKKHFGIVSALFTEIFLSINKYTFILGIIILTGLFLRIYKIDSTMPFISEQGWFYLSARDLLLEGKIPLVSLASSHPWLHQGALWSYMLAGVFGIFGFNPLNGAYFSIFIDLLSIIIFYFLGKSLFSSKIGLFAAMLYATSPLVIANARMPYHTNPIPLFVLLFIFFLYKWVGGNKIYFSLIIAVLAILYNFELATFPFCIIFLMILFFGFWRKRKWATSILRLRILLLSTIAFIIPMLPMLIYDIYHKFPQTFGFIIWLGYRFLVLFGYPPLHPEIPSASLGSVISFAVVSYQRLLFANNGFIAAIIFIFSFYIFYKRVMVSLINKKYKTSLIITALVVSLLVISFLAIKTPSDAYLPMLFPGIILLTAFSIERLPYKLSWVIIIAIVISNAYFQITFINKDQGIFKEQINVVKKIIISADGKEYNLKGNFADNYRYLGWWQGHGSSSEKQKLIFSVKQTNSGFEVIEEKRL